MMQSRSDAMLPIIIVFLLLSNYIECLSGFYDFYMPLCVNDNFSFLSSSLGRIVEPVLFYSKFRPEAVNRMSELCEALFYGL